MRVNKFFILLRYPMRKGTRPQEGKGDSVMKPTIKMTRAAALAAIGALALVPALEPISLGI